MDGQSLLASTEADSDTLLENQTTQAVRTQDFMYAEHETGERELYDLRVDPSQLESVHDNPAYYEVEAKLAERLAELRSCAGDACR